jgi:hypothetical protein
VFHLRSRTDNAITTAAAITELRRISIQTAQNKLRQRGIRPKRPYVGPVFTHVHRRTRVQKIKYISPCSFRIQALPVVGDNL